MANSTPLLKRMHEQDVDSLMPKIRLPDGADWEDTKLRVEAMIGQLAGADTAEDIPDDQDEANEEDPDKMPELKDQSIFD